MLRFRIREDPVVLLGMHRSGTTLLVELLSKLGLFTGATLAGYHEPVFFRDLNERILRASEGAWDRPLPFAALLDEPCERDAWVEDLRRKVSGLSFVRSYVGLLNARRFYGKEGMAWGWKEPRSTVTWPLWKPLFPRAKAVFLVRNGVDVAQSLKVREEARAGRIEDPYLSVRCLSLEASFELWREYNDLYLDSLGKDPDPAPLQVRFEDLLENPEEHVGRIADFAGLRVGADRIRDVCASVRRDRRFGFLSDPGLVAFHRRVKDAPLMKRFGYDALAEA